jgi:ankyrin repeat protein
MFSKHAREVALSLSQEAFGLCRDKDAVGLRAFLKAHPDVVFYLYAFEGKAGVNRSSNNTMTLAASYESPGCLQALLDFGADVNNHDRSSNTPLINSAQDGRIECTRLLLEWNADVAILGGIDGMAALHKASSKDEPECLQLLIEANADVNQRTMLGSTGLHHASQSGNVKCLRLLIENKADVERTSMMGNTGLIYAALNGHLECVKVLIEAKADVDHAGEHGMTAYHTASQNGEVECLRLLIENKADVDCKQVDGRTGLMVAAYEGHLECVKVLIEAKADVNVDSLDGDTALTTAFKTKHLSCLMVLLDQSANGGTPVGADTKAHALNTVLQWRRGAFSAPRQAVVFQLMAHDTDIDTAADGIPSKLTRSAASVYANTHRFIEQWYGLALNALSTKAEVDRRVGLGMHGLYQEPLERVLQYLGLSMDADQVVNSSMDNDHNVRRVLLPNCAHNANHWFQLFQQQVARSGAIPRK